MMMYESLYVVYVICGILFILALRGLASPETAGRGNYFGISGMAIVVLMSLLVLPSRNDFGILAAFLSAAFIGIVWGYKVNITKLPQMIALLNGLGGLSSVLVGTAQFLHQNENFFDVSMGIVVGCVAFSGSLIAFLKLQGIYKAGRLPFFNFLNALLGVLIAATWVHFANDQAPAVFYVLIFLSFIFGMTITMPVGGADMPIVICILNACSGFAAAAIGFCLLNVVLIMTGALVGASGSILAFAMSKAMNRNLFQVFFKEISRVKEKHSDIRIARSGSPSDAAFLMKNANKVIIVPGYGMAAAGAQHALKNMAFILETKYGVNVKFAIHPVAGRMPGHMNVLLAEAKVDYDKVFSLEEINSDFETADVAYVVGANDITNPAARTDSSSPLYGMPILEVSRAKTVFFVKRSLDGGYSGTQNGLFFAPNTLMLYGDAKKITEEIVHDL